MAETKSAALKAFKTFIKRYQAKCILMLQIVLRRMKTCGMLPSKTMLSLVFKLIQSGQKNWKRIRGFRKIADVIGGIRFTDGLSDEEIIELGEMKNAA